MQQNKALQNRGKSNQEIRNSKTRKNMPLKYDVDKSKYSKVRKRINARRKKEKRITRAIIFITLVLIIGLSAILIVNVASR